MDTETTETPMDTETTETNAAAAEATDPGDLEDFVDALESKLDAELAEIDSTYVPSDNGSSDDDPDTDTNVRTINMLGNTSRQQSTANMNAEGSDDEEETAPLVPADAEDSDDSDDGKEPAALPRFRRNQGLSYTHLKGREGDGSLPTVARPEEFGASQVSPNEAFLILESVMLTQYNLKQGIKRFGDRGKTAVLDELQQLYDRDVMEPLNPNNLSPAERKDTLRYLMILKEKRCGTIKGRGCADGQPQRDYMLKEDILLHCRHRSPHHTMPYRRNRKARHSNM
jgi:hypothetical protein